MMQLIKLFRLIAACAVALAAIGVHAREAQTQHPQNMPLEKIQWLDVDCPRVWLAQAVDSPEENPSTYDESASGPTLYNYFRTYQPTQGRYTQNDPIGLGGGINRFAYVNGNPLTKTDPLGLMGGGGNHSPSPPLPSVNDPCVTRFINQNYGDVFGFVVEIGNLQMYFPSANSDYKNTLKEGGQIVLEKSAATKGPGFAGRALMKAIPGNLAVGHVAGSGLATFGGLASGVVEVAGAFMTPFATTAMAQARQACSCQK